MWLCFYLFSRIFRRWKWPWWAGLASYRWRARWICPIWCDLQSFLDVKQAKAALSHMRWRTLAISLIGCVFWQFEILPSNHITLPKDLIDSIISRPYRLLNEHLLGLLAKHDDLLAVQATRILSLWKPLLAHNVAIEGTVTVFSSWAILTSMHTLAVLI